MLVKLSLEEMIEDESRSWRQFTSIQELTRSILILKKTYPAQFNKVLTRSFPLKYKLPNPVFLCVRCHKQQLCSCRINRKKTKVRYIQIILALTAYKVAFTVFSIHLFCQKHFGVIHISKRYKIIHTIVTDEV